jgi:rubrerythrin
MTIQPADYAYLSQLVFADLKNHKIGSSQYKNKNAIYQELKALARRKKKEAKTPMAVQHQYEYKCLSCENVHTKVKTSKTCPSCGSDDLEKQKKVDTY